MDLRTPEYQQARSQFLDTFAYWARNLTRLLIASSITSMIALAASNVHAADIEYVYDEAGRLVGVYALSGDAAQYVYDAAGNILEIKRFTASQVAVIEFTPNSGPVGTTVTIQGTGFSATPSSNAVAFNGVAATVSSSTVRRLTVLVPAGATTGPISVTVGANNAVSAANFVVTAAGDVGPAISSFSPGGGPASTVVSLSGTNFGTTPNANTLILNSTYLQISAASATSLTTTIPANASSGKFKISTQYGSSTSAADFVVPFGSFALGDIVTNGRVIIDSAPTLYSIGTPGKTAMMLFDGVQGQSLGLGITAITFTPGGGSATFHFRRPDNTELMPPLTVTAASNTTIDLPVLPTTGTYSIAIVPGASYRMDGTLTLSNDVSAVLGSEGAITASGISRAGQNGRYALTVTGGQSLAFFVYDLLAAVQTSRIDLMSPTGVVLATASSISSGAYFQTQPLTYGGTYTLLVSPNGTGVGTWKVQYGNPDLTITAFTPGAVVVNSNGSYSIPFTATVANQGTVGVRGVPWYDYSYLSTDVALDTTDSKTSATVRTDTQALAGGGYTWTGTATTATTTAPGSYTLFAKADGWDVSGLYSTVSNVLKETVETNNTTSATVVLPTRPDLTAHSLSVGAISVAASGAYSFPVSFVVKNDGASTAKASWYNYCYLSDDGTLSTTDDTLGYLQRIIDLAPAAEFTVNLTCITSAKTPGNYTLFVKADGWDYSGKYSANSLIAEADETNNTASAAIALPTRPDLVVTTMSLGTITVNPSGSYSFPMTFTVRNNGVTTAKPSWYTECYLSVDGTLGTTDDYLGNHQRSLELAASDEYTQTITCTTPTTTTPGTYTLFVKTDGRNSGGKYSAAHNLVEQDETNNASSTSLVLPTK